jgi:hypothetical protein
MPTNEFQIRARFNESSIRVYQAYSAAIAESALRAGRFVAPFRFTRMTWIKPSFNWMMYRSGFASKPGQEMVLGVDISREGFDWALEHAVLSSFHPSMHGSWDEWRRQLEQCPVRVQWDPERDWRLLPIEGVRTVQIGLSGIAVERFVNEWIVHIEDLTPLAHSLGRMVPAGMVPEQRPDRDETTYRLQAHWAARLIPENKGYDAA